MSTEFKLNKALNEIRDLRLRIIDLEMKERDHARRLALAGTILEQLQPILGRLIAGQCVLEQKGIFNVKDLATITEKQADYFIETASKKPPEEVRDKPNGTGTVADNSGNSGSGVSGTPGDGGSPASDTKSENGNEPVITRFQALRAASGSSNRIVNISEAKKKNIPT